MHLPFSFIVSPPELSLPPEAPSSSQPLVVPEPAASSTSPRRSVIALLRELLARQDSEYAEFCFNGVAAVRVAIILARRLIGDFFEPCWFHLRMAITLS